MEREFDRRYDLAINCIIGYYRSMFWLSKRRALMLASVSFPCSGADSLSMRESSKSLAETSPSMPRPSPSKVVLLDGWFIEHDDKFLGRRSDPVGMIELQQSAKQWSSSMNLFRQTGSMKALFHFSCRSLQQFRVCFGSIDRPTAHFNPRSSFKGHKFPVRTPDGSPL